MSTYPFYFKIKLFDDNYYIQSEIGLADSFAHAAKQLEENFGTNLISIEHLELLEESNSIFLPEDIYYKITHNDSYGAPRRIKEKKL